jgi:arsenite methyltransferase
MDLNVKYEEVKTYYGQTLKDSADLKTSACCSPGALPDHIQHVLKDIHEEVRNKYYGCGLAIPFEVGGLRILDLGSGSGRDCFIASRLVGENGSVVGVDMTDEQLDVANRYVRYHTEKFGFDRPNVHFLKGNIDKLDSLGFEEGSFDLVISNCVVNLSMDKGKLFRDIYRLLKPGGEMYFSDVYSDRRIVADLRQDAVLWGECLSGALYWNDFLKLAKQAGFRDPRVAENHPIEITEPEIKTRIGDIGFYSVTYRLFKIDKLEEDCEDYGQAVRYRGTIMGQEASYDLDDHHHFPKGKMMPVCGNTFRMLAETRLAGHFEIFGTWDTHYGIFEGCGGKMPFASGDPDKAACC